MKIIKIALCEGRHQMPEGVEGAIFPNTLNPTDIEGLDRITKGFIDSHLNTKIDLYVTGLTVALVSVIKACHDQPVALTLYHFDRETNSYYPQVVQEYPHICPFCGAVSTGWFCPQCGAS